MTHVHDPASLAIWRIRYGCSGTELMTLVRGVAWRIGTGDILIGMDCVRSETSDSEKDVFVHVSAVEGAFYAIVKRSTTRLARIARPENREPKTSSAP